MRSSPLARWTGLLIGVALAIAVLLAGRMQPSSADAPASLSISTQPTIKLGVYPASDDFLATRRLVPGGPPARGTVKLSNYTTRRLEARLRLSGRAAGLDRLVRLELRARGATLYRGRLGELHSWGAVKVRLGPKRKRRIEFRAWLPRGVESGYEGRFAELKLSWRTRKAAR